MRRFAFLLLAFAVFAGFIALGTWQLQRRVWKLDLIARVEQRIHAPAVAAPGPAQWPAMNVASDEYRRVEARGVFLAGQDTLVQASTDLGSGFWVLTPMRLNDGGLVLVNRGFVASMTSAAPVPAGPAAIDGLLRMSQPGGGFLRHNDAAANRWYSRDVQAIAAARGLDGVAPYFIDADAAPGNRPQAEPVGGLTVISFPNNHLVYALTWFALALMTAAAAWRGVRAWRTPGETPILRGKQNPGDSEDGNTGVDGNDR